MPKKKENNKITLEDLAAMVARGFDRVEERFQEFEKRFTDIKGDMGQMEQKFETRLDTIENKIDKINDRFVPWHAFDRLVTRVDKLEGN